MPNDVSLTHEYRQYVDPREFQDGGSYTLPYNPYPAQPNPWHRPHPPYYPVPPGYHWELVPDSYPPYHTPGVPYCETISLSDLADAFDPASPGSGSDGENFD